MNNLAARIAEDLGYIKPSPLPYKIYLDQLCYGALAEWLRAITCDTDPLLGNNRLGVSRAYLEVRGSRVLDKLVRGLLEKEFPFNELEEQTRWMIDAMIEIKELWTPTQDVIACPGSIPAGIWRGRTRMLGHSSEIESMWKARGMSRYVYGVDEPLHRFLDGVNRAGKDLMLLDSMEKKIRIRNSICDMNVTDPKIKQFLLMTAWPVNPTPLKWDQTTLWLFT